MLKKILEANRETIVSETMFHIRRLIPEYKKINDGEHMKDAPMNAVFGCMLFFYSLGIDLSQAMMNYLQDQEETALMQFPNSQKDGDGINQFTNSLREMLQDLRISQN
jgi:hypothetical protein